MLLGRKVAIKEYFPEGVVHRDTNTQRVLPFGGSMEEEFEKGRSRALQEARVAAQMEDVPNTVRIYSVLEANNTVYIVMEYINGITLTGYVQQSGGKMSWVQAWPIIEPVLNTLSRVHARGIVHRDVSPVLHPGTPNIPYPCGWAIRPWKCIPAAARSTSGPMSMRQWPPCTSC